MPPRDASEDGRDLLGREGEADAELGRPPLVLRERPEEDGEDVLADSESDPPRTSSGSASDSLPGPRIEPRDRLRLALEAREAMGESGTAWPAASGGVGGGLLGPSMPPTFGTPGSRRRMWFTSSSAASRNWTKWH